jgi:hypothetical protein
LDGPGVTEAGMFWNKSFGAFFSGVFSNRSFGIKYLSCAY